jgi:hypothetical protein
MNKKEYNEFNLDFPAPQELTNDEVKERDLYSQLIKDGFKFSNTPDGIGSAYIMKDGKFLFLEQNKAVLNSNIVTHGTLDLYLQDKGYISEDTLASRVLCQTDDAIRINDGKNFFFETIIGLPKNKITAEQTKALEDWIWSMMSRRKYHIAVGNELVSEVFRSYNLSEVDPSYVTSRINTYYRNGILREAKDIKQEELLNEQNS